MEKIHTFSFKNSLQVPKMAAFRWHQTERSNLKIITKTKYSEKEKTQNFPLFLSISTMIANCKKSSILCQSSYNSLYMNPLNELTHNRSNSVGSRLTSNTDHLEPNPFLFNDNKENAVPNKQKVDEFRCDKENIAVPANGSSSSFSTTKQFSNLKSYSTGCRALKPSSLQFCMQMNEPSKVFGGSNIWDPSESDTSSSLKIWDYSDSEAAPASSWTTLPNKWVEFLCEIVFLLLKY